MLQPSWQNWKGVVYMHHYDLDSPIHVSYLIDINQPHLLVCNVSGDYIVLVVAVNNGSTH